MDSAQPSKSDLLVSKYEDEIVEMKPLYDKCSEENPEVKSPTRQQRREFRTPAGGKKNVGNYSQLIKNAGKNSQLIKALRRRDWKKVDQFVNQNDGFLLTNIKEGTFSIFSSLASYGDDEALRLMEKFLNKVDAVELEKLEFHGGTPLTCAAALGNIKATKFLLKFNKKLLNVRSIDGLYPIHSAATGGDRETIEYLLSVTEVEDSSPFVGQSGLTLLLLLINSKHFDIALNLLKRYPELTRPRRFILELLAKKPKAFASGSRLGYWERLIYKYIPVQKEHPQSPQAEKKSVEGDVENPTRNSSTKDIASGFLSKMATTFGTLSQNIHIILWNALMQLVPCIKGIHDTKFMHIQAVEIVRMVCAGVEQNFREASVTLKMPVLMAAKLGIYEIVDEILDVYSNSFLFDDEDGHNIHMLSVLHRREELFKLLNLQQGTKSLSVNDFDKSSNNILHLAGRLVPSSEVAGAALQMQRELQWFKAVENCFSPSFQETCNNLNKTPEEVFIEEHEKLVKEGEKWMKDTAQSCSVVVSLIITIVFAAAFTVPGGNNNEGIPNFVHNLPFIVFVTSDALALISSTTSLLMFLGILTSRYSQEDFLVSLPKKLTIGLISMFFAIAAVMVAFGGTVFIVLSQPWKWVIIPVALLSCIPVTLFALLQFPLLVEVFWSTYRPSLFQPSKIGMQLST